MWDYDKLFAEGNIVGIKNCYHNCVFNRIVTNKPMFWVECFKNEKLCDRAECLINENSNITRETDFEIQYIIRLDEHGNVVEKLFDREKDMKLEPKPMPELETGMFVRVIDNGNMDYTVLGYVDIQNCRIIYQDGKYNDIVKLKKLTGKVDIVEIYSQRTNCFNQCLGNDTLIWRSPEYQAYLDSKSN